LTFSTVVVDADGVVDEDAVGAGAGTDVVPLEVGAVLVAVLEVVLPVIEAVELLDAELVVVLWVVAWVEFVALLDPPQATSTGASTAIAATQSARGWRAVSRRCMGSPLIAARPWTFRRRGPGRTRAAWSEDTPHIGRNGIWP